MTRDKSARMPCPCDCRCGATRHQSTEFCYLCTNGVHHECGVGCGSFPGFRGIGYVNGETPERRACRGGRAAA